MNTTLYIIGNGFDLHHGIRSKYVDFAEFLKSKDPGLFRLVEKYFAVDDEFWGAFEARLADLDNGALIEDASTFLANYGADGWSDSGHHDYQFEIEQVAMGLSSGLKSRFAHW